MAAIRVLIADDHALVRDSLASLLGTQPDLEIVGKACDGQDAVELTRRLQPDVVLLDIIMPGLNGIAAARKITEELPWIRVIGLSGHDDDHLAAAVLEAGAVRHMSKTGPVELLLDAIRSTRGE